MYVRVESGHTLGLPRMTRPYFALVSATFSRRGSLRKPMPCSAEKLKFWSKGILKQMNCYLVTWGAEKITALLLRGRKLEKENIPRRNGILQQVSLYGDGCDTCFKGSRNYSV